MPIYAYRCDTCGHAKDVLQKISDPLLTVCPACGAETFRKQLTAAGFQLKGSGWYVTDFRDGGKGKPEAGDKAKGDAAGASATAEKAGDKGAEKAADKGGDKGAAATGEGASSPAPAPSPAPAADSKPKPPPASGGSGPTT